MQPTLRERDRDSGGDPPDDEDRDRPDNIDSVSRRNLNDPIDNFVCLIFHGNAPTLILQVGGYHRGRIWQAGSL
jgi:hypothetical protein